MQKHVERGAEKLFPKIICF